MTAPGSDRDATILRLGIDLSEVSRSQHLARKAEARMIQSVDKVRAQLEVESFLKAHGFRQRKVNNGKSWSPERRSSPRCRIQTVSKKEWQTLTC